MSYITIQEAAEQLAKMAAQQPEAILVLASDPEGNAFHPVSELAAAFYLPGGPAGGELWTQAEEGSEDPEEEPPDEAEMAVVCWPGYDPPGSK
jgi:hypothetical protein